MEENLRQLRAKQNWFLDRKYEYEELAKN